MNSLPHEAKCVSLEMVPQQPGDGATGSRAG